MIVTTNKTIGYKPKRLNTVAKVLIFTMFTMLSLFVFNFTKIHSAYALLTTAQVNSLIPSDVQYGPNSVNHYDINPPPAQPALFHWVSLSGNSANDTAVTVPSGTPSVALQLNSLVFLYHTQLQSPTPYFPTDAYPYPPSSDVPNCSASNACVQFHSEYLNQGIYVCKGSGDCLDGGAPTVSTSPVNIGGSISSIAGATQSIGYNQNSRYWSESTSFTYTPASGSFTTPPATTTTYNTTVNLWLNSFTNYPLVPTNQCDNNNTVFPSNAQIANGSWGTICQAQEVSFNISIIVQPTTTYVGGYVYGWNGGSSQKIVGANVYMGVGNCGGSGSNYWTTTDGNGNYKFLVNNGSIICIRIVENSGPPYSAASSQNVAPPGWPPPGDVININPDLSSGPYSGVNCGSPPNTNGTSYEFVEAEPGNSLDGTCPQYNGVFDSNYNFVVKVSATLTCGVTANPAEIIIGNSTNVVVGVNVNASMWWFGTPVSSFSDVTANLSGPSAQTLNNFGAASPPAGFAIGYSDMSAPVNIAGNYSVSASVTGNSSNNVSSTSCNAPGGLTVAYAPYVRVFGGDVLAGVSSDYVSSCFDNTSGINSFNGFSGVNNEGGGTTEADLSTGTNNGFVSGQFEVTNLTSLDPLSFANIAAPGPYGGGFSAIGGPCSGEDFYTQAQNTHTFVPCPSTINLSKINGGVSLGASQSYKCITTGNVTIDSNITYSVAGLNATDLPDFEVISRGGNIVIDTKDPVTNAYIDQIDGTLIAEQWLVGGKLKGGTVYDTGTGPSGTNNVVTEPTNADNGTNTFVKDRLVIDGSIVANQIDLYRTYGSVEDDTTPITAVPDPNDAEEFNYSPVNWLNPSPLQSSTPQVDAITSLPPIL